MDTHGMNQARTPLALATQHLGHSAVHLSLPDGSSAIIMLHGAHVVSWQAGSRGEQLYLSPTASMAPGQAIRGGVPVIFPQFEQRGPDRSLPRHGLVRTRPWAIDALSTGPDYAQATFALTDSDETQALWPHAFALELTVCLTPSRLDMELHVENTGERAWDFSAALHTYLKLSDISQARLQGLEGCQFVDAIHNEERTEDSPEKRFAGETDRIYMQAPRSLLLRDGTRRVTIDSAAFEDTVLWNPGPDKCAALADMPDEDWRRMLCVEAAQVLSPPKLAQGESWTARQSLTLDEQA
jgi:glucose-6-phosphate 1-epimerase